jgi:hypothetical protein
VSKVAPSAVCGMCECSICSVQSCTKNREGDAGFWIYGGSSPALLVWEEIETGATVIKSRGMLASGFVPKTEQTVHTPKFGYRHVIFVHKCEIYTRGFESLHILSFVLSQICKIINSLRYIQCSYVKKIMFFPL